MKSTYVQALVRVHIVSHALIRKVPSKHKTPLTLKDMFPSTHYAIFRVQNGNTQPGTLRPMLLPLVDTDLNFRTGA